MEENPGKKIIRNFLDEETKKNHNEKYAKALDYFNAGDLEKALLTLEYVLKHPMNENKDMVRENKFLLDIVLLMKGRVQKNTDQVCNEGMRFLGLDGDISRAVRLSVGLQNLIKEEKREPSKIEQNFIKVTEDYLRRNSES